MEEKTTIEKQNDILQMASLQMAKAIENFLKDKKQFKRYHKTAKKEGSEVIEEHISKKADTKAMREMVGIMKELILVQKLIREQELAQATGNEKRTGGVIILAQQHSADTQIS